MGRKTREEIRKELDESKYIATCECGNNRVGTDKPLHRHILCVEVWDFCKTELKYRDGENKE